jgi:hypothetical protein
VDREPAEPPPEKILIKLAAKLQTRLRSADAIAISDYGFGAASPWAVKQALRGKKSSSVATLDARQRLDGYANCGITSATPNEAELEALYHRSIGRDLHELQRCGMATCKKMGLQSLLVSRGKDGMALFERTRKKFTSSPGRGYCFGSVHTRACVQRFGIRSCANRKHCGRFGSDEARHGGGYTRGIARRDSGRDIRPRELTRCDPLRQK